MCNHNPEVLSADDDRDDHPRDQQAVVPQMSSKYQQQCTTDPEETIKDGIFDDGTDADIFIITLWAKIIIKCPNGCSILDNVKDGCNDSDNQLKDTNDQN